MEAVIRPALLDVPVLLRLVRLLIHKAPLVKNVRGAVYVRYAGVRAGSGSPPAGFHVVQR